ncbi:MAG: A24 family peptidase [Cellvibrionales bacterium]|nr:A24 family peptidase [Cellvibrionales bacterium]
MPQEEYWLIVVIVLLSSLMIGSFLNVVIYRLPIMLKRQWQSDAEWMLAEIQEDDPSAYSGVTFKKEPPQGKFNLAYPASSCPSCHAKIKIWQNIPIVSFLLLKGQCGNCQAKIGSRYPLVELLTLMVAGVVLWQSTSLLPALLLLFLSFVFICLIFIDADHQLLPDQLVLPVLWLGLIINSQQVFVLLPEALAGAVAGYLSLWSVYWLFKLATGKEGMGYGDFKLFALVGAWFGWQILIPVIIFSSFVGAVWGIAFIVFKGRDSQQPMAFGPFIAIAAWLCVMFPSVFNLGWFNLV